MRHVIRSIGLAFVLAFASTSYVHAQPKIDVNVGFQARAIGVYQADVTTAWTDIDTTDFSYITVNSATSSNTLVSVTVINTHATQTLYILLKAGGAIVTTAALPVEAGKAVNLPGLMGTAGGAVTMSLQGSAVNTTANVIAYWR